MTEERRIYSIAAPPDDPGCLIFTASTEDGKERWRCFRKKNGTYWPILAQNTFPSSGRMHDFELGEQIMDEKTLRKLQELYVVYETRMREENKP